MPNKPVNESMRPRVLHITNWYPNPWDDIEGNFIKAQFNIFRDVTDALLVCVQVRDSDGGFLSLRTAELGEGQRGYFILTRIRQDRIRAFMTTVLLLAILLRHRAWKFDLLHFHIAWPLLAHVHVWRWILRVPIIISEHWSAYHYNFHLPKGSPALNRMRRPFRYGFPMIAVSQALLDDIRKFAKRSDFAGYVIPNVVPLHGAAAKSNPVPTLFAVSRWVEIKAPLPMIEGMIDALKQGARFRLVVGGYGSELAAMQELVEENQFAESILFPGKLTKDDIAERLSSADGYVFSSRYETFSVACAEALGAGIPLLGPAIPAISEYAGDDDWQRVETRDRQSWSESVVKFVGRLENGEFDRNAIAERARTRFSQSVLIEKYRTIINDTLGQQSGAVKLRPNGVK